jgi:DNA primase
MLDDMEMQYKVYKEEYRTWDLPPYETDKSLLLWNAHKVLTNPGPLVIVEGFKGCMWVHQAGIPNVVALMTKYMSWAQRWLIQKHGRPFVLMLDNDDAGIQGTMDISKSLAEVSPLVRIVDYDEDQPTDVPIQYIPLLIESAMDYQMLQHMSSY